MMRFKLSITRAVFVSLIGFFSFCCLQAQAWQSDNGNGTFNNPVLYADYPDPDIIRVSNDFYMVSTTFADLPGINILHSKDMVNWELVSHCATNLDWSNIYNTVGGYRQGFWAGGIRYYNGTFYVVANPTGANGRIYYATNAAGPWQFHTLNQGIYDPSLLIDTNGVGYIFEGHGPQNILTLNASFSQIISVSNNVVNSGGEGSHAVRVGNYYYLFNANPGVYPFQLLCSRATNIFGPWETNHVCLTSTTGGHQGGIVDIDDSGTNWFGFVHQDSGAVGRMTRVGPVYWSNNWPVFGTVSAPNQMASSYAKPILGQPIMQPATSDEFTNSTLGLQWQWNQNPDNTRWSLTQRSGYLRLRPTQATNFWTARNTLGQKGQGSKSQGVVKFDISSLQSGDIAGFGTLGSVNGYIYVTADSNGNKTLGMVVDDRSTNLVTYAANITFSGTNLYLRTDLDFIANVGMCSYSADGANWMRLGADFPLKFDISTGTFQGEKYAIFCYNPNTASSAGYVDVDYFRFNDSFVPVSLQRGRPHLNAARTTFVSDNGQLLRGPFTSTEWTSATTSQNIANMKNFGFNAIHLYAESFDPNYPNSGSTAPGYAVTQVDKIVAETRTNGLYLIMTIGNGAYNGDYSLAWVTNFWKFYASRYANETHVIFEIQNEPVAWGPPYSSGSANPPGAVNMEIAAYNTIRSYAPNSPVLLFSYSVISGTGSGGTSGMLSDIQAFNSAVFGSANAVWTNEAVAFHGYGGWQGVSTAVAGLIAAGYPCFMTEYYSEPWGSDLSCLDAQLASELERQKISWLTFQYVPPTGVATDVTQPQYFKDVVDRAGLSWVPDYGTWPAFRSPYGNGGQPRNTTTNWSGNVLSGTLRIQAEDFDTGGEGVAYHDIDAANDGGQYRTNEAVDIETTTDTGGGYDVGWTSSGEWLEYTIWVREPGYYTLGLRCASPNSGCSVNVMCNNRDKTSAWTLPNTGGYQTWTTITTNVFLEFGRQKLRLNITGGGFNLNWIELTPATSGTVANGAYKLLNRDNGLAMQGVTGTGRVVATNYIGSTLQQWNLQYLGGGQYKITSVNNSWSWNMFGNQDGVPLGFVWWWSPGGDRSQTFIIQPAGNGYYRFVPATSGLSVETTLADPQVVDQYVDSDGASQQWGILPLSAPQFPVGLSASYTSPTVVNLVWNSVAAATSYNVKRATISGGPYTTIAAGIATTDFSDASVTAGVEYYYVVSAVVGAVESLNSAEVMPAPYSPYSGNIATNGTATASADNPPNETAARAFDGSTSTKWFNNNAGSTGWLQYNFGVGTNRTVIRYALSSADDDYGRDPRNWQFQGSQNGTTWTTLDTQTAQTFTARFQTKTYDINNSTAYQYYRLNITANSGGAGIQLSEMALMISSGSPPTPPATPTGLTATAASSLQINLAWNVATNAASYNLKRSTTNGGPYATIAAGLATTNFSDFGLSADTTYYYVVSAVNAGGESTNSMFVSATTLPLSLGSLIHRYSFNETGGSTVADSIGGPAWDGTLPNGGTFSGGQLILSSNSQQYVNLPGGIISTSFMSAVTIEAWATFQTNLPWATWFFGFGTTNNGAGGNCLLCSEGGARFAVSGVEPSWQGETNAYANGSWSGETLHITCVFNPPGGYLAIYTNGVLAGTNVSGPLAIASITNICSFINRSLYSSDPYVNLTVNEFRVYNTALSLAEITATEALGPDSMMSANTPVLDAAMNGTNLVLSWPLGNAGYTLQSRTNLISGSWVTVASPASQIVGNQWRVLLSQTPNGVAFYRLIK